MQDAFGVVAETSLGTPMSHIRVPEFESKLYPQFQFVADAHLRRQLVLA